MGHAIHKHMSGRAYDAKQAYNKDLSDSARLHYLENDEHDKGMSRYGSDHGDSPAELTAGGKKKIMSSDANPAFKKAIASSPINNISYGDKSGVTGYIGEERADLMKYNPVDDRAGMSRYGSDQGNSPMEIKKSRSHKKSKNSYQSNDGMSRHSNYGNSPANGFRDTLKKVGTTAKNLVKDVGYQIGDMISPDPGGMAQAMSFGDFRSAQNDANRNKKIERKVHDKSIADAESGKSYFSIGKAVRD